VESVGQSPEFARGQVLDTLHFRPHSRQHHYVLLGDLSYGASQTANGDLTLRFHLLLLLLLSLSLSHSLTHTHTHTPSLVQFQSAASNESNAIYIIEAICIGFFTIEIFLRVFATPSLKAYFKSVMTWIDIIAVVPFYFDVIITHTTGNDATPPRKRTGTSARLRLPDIYSTTPVITTSLVMVATFLCCLFLLRSTLYPHALLPVVFLLLRCRVVESDSRHPGLASDPLSAYLPSVQDVAGYTYPVWQNDEEIFQTTLYAGVFRDVGNGSVCLVHLLRRTWGIRLGSPVMETACWLPVRF